MMARQVIGGKERQSGRTPWRAVSLCGELEALLRACPANVPEAGEKRNSRSCARRPAISKNASLLVNYFSTLWSPLEVILQHKRSSCLETLFSH